jgi:acetyl-CoA C-acetyltransferase
MADAYIVQAVRTAGGKRGGRLAGWHPADMAGQVLNAIVDRSGIDPSAIDDVIMGCVSQGGEQGFQVGRNAVLASKLPESVPAVTIDRQCGSSQQSIQFAAQAVMSGTQDVVIAAGVESMTRVPMGSTGMLFAQAGLGKAKSPAQEARYPGIQFSQFMGAEMMAKKHGFSRPLLAGKPPPRLGGDAGGRVRRRDRAAGDRDARRHRDPPHRRRHPS